MKSVTPSSQVDEAKWGFAVWKTACGEVVPNYLRELNEQLEENLNYKLPVEFRTGTLYFLDGRRHATATRTSPQTFTRHVLLLSRWKATGPVPERYSVADL